jgi:hypothetical protein
MLTGVCERPEGCGGGAMVVAALRRAALSLVYLPFTMQSSEESGPASLVSVRPFPTCRR